MPVSVEAIEKGGSGRKFWRINVGNRTVILVRYTDERPENSHYVEIGRFLHTAGVRVPEVFLHEQRDGLIVMEDAGTTDLWSFRNEPWEIRRALYQRTLDQALLLHTRAHLTPECPHLQQAFDATLYAWEQNYFIEHCLGRHLGIAEQEIGHYVDRARLSQIADFLASLPRCFVHRDFQSQNIIVQGSDVCLIDFQGLRPGLAQYDLASLLLDPYVNLTSTERDELLAYYMKAAGVADAASFLQIYDLCAMQRLMQALGAYGKLGYADHRADFLQHFPAAIPRLRDVLSRITGMEPLHKLLSKHSK